MSDDWHNKKMDMASSNDQCNIDSTNIDLIELRVSTKTLLVDSI